MIKKIVALVCIMASPATAQSNEEIVVQFTGFLGNLRLTADDVRADLVGSDPDMPQIAIAMEEEAAAAFGRFTTTHVNRSVSFYVCGEQMMSVTFEAPVDNGFAISDAMPKRRATAMVAALNGQRACP